MKLVGMPSRDVLLGLILAVAMVSGIVYGLAAGDARVASTVPAGGEADFLERSSFCPPMAVKNDEEAHAYVAFSSTSNEPTKVGLEPQVAARATLRPGRLATRGLDPSQTGGGLDVVGFGSRVPAAAIFQITKPVDGLLSSSCPSHTSAHWYISGGTSALKTDEKILLYNPFSNDAAVRVTFYTPAGEQVSANLSNVGVGAGSTRVIPVNKFAKPRNTLGAVIRVVRGRVVAWASVAYRKHDGRDPGHTLRPGVTSPGTAWYLPDAAIDDGVEQHVTVLNPTEREASINVSLTMGSGPLPVATLATVPVGPRSTRELDLGQYLAKHRADPGRVSVTVRSANDVPVVVEGTTFYSTPGIQGVASVPAVQRPARRLVLEPPALAPTMDGIVVMNPDASPARVDVTLERVGGTSFSPKKLRNLRVPSGLRLRIPLSSFTQGKPMAAMVESSVPVVAGRTAYGRKAGDVASLAAVPLLPLPGPSAGR